MDLTQTEANTLLVLGLLPTNLSVKTISSMTQADLPACEAAVASLCERHLVERAGDHVGLTQAGYVFHVGSLLVRAADAP